MSKRVPLTREVDQLVKEYEASLRPCAPKLRKNGAMRQSLREAARIELGLRAFLKQGGFKGFTDTFEDLHGLVQLPGVAVQRLMADGYGFGAEGDWKTCALVRAMKVMAPGLKGGTSFMEDYTYHLDPKAQPGAGAHMLEICPTHRQRQAVAGSASAGHRRQGRPGAAGVRHAGRRGPQRLDHRPGQPFSAAGQRSRGCRARKAFAQAAGGARGLDAQTEPANRGGCVDLRRRRAPHRLFSQAVTTEMLEDFAAMAGIELVVIDAETRLRPLKQELSWNEVYYGLRNGFVS